MDVIFSAAGFEKLKPKVPCNAADISVELIGAIRRNRVSTFECSERDMEIDGGVSVRQRSTITERGVG